MNTYGGHTAWPCPSDAMDGPRGPVIGLARAATVEGVVTERGATDGRTPRNRGQLVGCLLASSIAAAPFVALLYDLDAGLAVMALALGATAWLTRESARGLGAAQRSRLHAAALLNGVLALVCVAILVARLV